MGRPGTPYRAALGTGRWLVVFVCCCLAATAYGVDPKAVPYYERAVAEHKAGRLINALKYMKKAQSVAPQDADLGKFQGELNKARDKEVEKLLREAEAHKSGKDVKRAIEALRKLLILNPEHDKARESLNKLVDVTREVQHYQNAGINVPAGSGKELDPARYSAVSSMQKARDTMRQGNLLNALQQVKALRLKDPGYTEARELEEQLTQLIEARKMLADARSHLDRGAGEAALALIERQLKTMPDNLELLLMKARAQVNVGLLHEALDTMAYAHKRGASAAVLLPVLASVFDARRDVDAALAIRTADAYPNPLSWRESARIWVNAHSYATATLVLLLLCLCGAAYWSWQRIDELLSVMPASHCAAFVRILVTGTWSGLAGQLTAMRKLTATSRFPWLDYAIGLVFLSTDDHAKAIPAFQRALDSDSLAPKAYFFLGAIRAKTESASFGAANFEQSICMLLRGFSEPFAPRALRRLEADVLQKLAPVCQTDPLARTAWLGVNAVVTGGDLNALPQIPAGKAHPALDGRRATGPQPKATGTPAAATPATDANPGDAGSTDSK